MNHIRKISFIMLIILILTATACSRGDDSFYIYHATTSSFKSADPQIASGDTAKIIAVNCFEGLVYINADGAVEAAAAESYTISSDGLVYTFKLRENMRWRISNSAKKALSLPDDFDTRVTAHDFVFALQRAVLPDTKADDAILLSPIINAEEIMDGILSENELAVTALSDYELEIRLNTKQTNFIYTLAQPISMPCNKAFFELTGGRYGLKLEYLITNGPFYFSRWTEGYSLQLTKFADYTGGRKASADAAYIYITEDNEKLLENLNSGTYTSAFLDKNQFDMIDNLKNFSYFEFENILWSLCFNFNSEVFSNVDMRKAIIYSLDSNIFKGEHNENTLANRYIPPFCEPTFKNSFDLSNLYSFNEEEARNKLKAGLFALDTSSVEVTLICATQYEQIIKEQLQEWQRIFSVSINIKIKILELAELEKAFFAGEYDLAFYPVYANSIEANSFFKAFVTGDAANFINMNNEEYDEKFSDLFDTAIQSEYENIYSSLENILAETAAYYPIYYDKNYFLYSNNMKGIYFYSTHDYVNFAFTTPT